MADRNELVPLPGSYLPPMEGATPIGAAVGAKEISVSVWMRRKPNGQPMPDFKAKDFKPVDRAEFDKSWGADENDLKAVLDYLKSVDPKIERVQDENFSDTARRLLLVKGTVTSMEKAFGVKLQIVQPPKPAPPIIVRDGIVMIPSSLNGIVLGVFGLDNRPIGTPGGTAEEVELQVTAASGLPTPPQIAALYKFPKPAGTSKGQVIALMQFGGGYDPNHPKKYFTDLGVAQPTLVDVGVAGGANTPGHPVYDNEVTLDIEVAGSVAEEATLVTYFAPHNELGWIEGIASAVHDVKRRPFIMSISWGAPELATSNTLTWSQSGMAAMSGHFLDAAIVGMTVLASAGNNGSDCGVGDWNTHVSYPASDPLVIACSGTTIADYANNPAGEIAWTRGGGGISDVYPVPGYQDEDELPISHNTLAKARGVPDISGYANPGYEFWVGVHKVMPGTSLVAPLYAAAIARRNAKSGTLTGYFHPNLYAPGAPIRDIDDPVSNSTSNGLNGAPGYYGRAGWDARTGLGIFEPGV